MRVPRMLEPLRIRDFALLWTGMTTSLVGDFVFLVAYPWQTYQLTKDTSVLGWLSAAYLTPAVLFVTVGGVLTDRVERRKLGFVYSSAAAGALVTSFAYAQRGMPRRPLVVAFTAWALATLAVGGYGLARHVWVLLAFGVVAGSGVALGNAI